MSLERSYRRLVRTYPSAWRDRRGEEVLAVLLDAAEARSARRPSPAEIADVIGHGLLARVGVVTGAVHARERELTAALALASLTALSAVFLFFGEWWPWPTTPLEPGGPVPNYPGTPGPFSTAGGPLLAVLLLPAVLVLLGRPRAARSLLAALLPLLVLLPVAARLLGVNRPALWALAGLVALGGLSLLAPVRRRGLLLVLTVPLTAITALSVLSGLGAGQDPRPFFYYGNAQTVLTECVPWAVLATVVVVVVVVVVVAVGLRAMLPTVAVGAVWLAMFGLRFRSTYDSPGLPYLLTATALASVALLYAATRRQRTDRLA